MKKPKLAREEKNGFSNRKPTLRTIANLTGLSLSSVSLALRDDRHLKSETREKVRAVAQDIGYVPDRAGVRLRTGKSNVIALVLPSSEGSGGFSEMLIKGVGAGLKNTNYHLTIVPEFSDDDPVTNTRYVLDDGSADGIILTHTEPRDERVKLMMDANFPFVTSGRTEFFSQHPYHDVHGEHFARLAAARLSSLGCKNLMLLIGEDNTMNRQFIINGFNRATADLSVTGHVLTVDKNAKLLENIHKYYGDLRIIPDGYICNEEFMGLQICHAQLQDRLPKSDRFHIVCRESSGILPLLFPATDTIQDDPFAMGKELVRTLILRIQGNTPVLELQSMVELKPQWRSGVNCAN